MIALNIIWPVFAMTGLIFVIWFVVLWQRMRHVGRTPPEADTFRSHASAGVYFEPVALPADNLSNLFEMPVLFYALIPLLVIAGQASPAQVILAWAFVLLRAAHSYVHIVVRRVQLRAPIYWLSTAVLMAMWLGFFIDMLAAASRYSHALGGAAAA